MAFFSAHTNGRAGRRARGPRVARLIGARRRGMVLRLSAGEMLFQPGDAKNDLVYRIRKGRVQVSGVLKPAAPGGAPSRIYSAGAFVGLGFLDAYAAFGEALDAAEVVAWSRGDFERFGEQRPDYRAQQDEAVRLEFLWRRAETVAKGR